MKTQDAYRKLLLATDGSAFSAGALRVGVELARRTEAQLAALGLALYNPEYSTLVPNLEEEAGSRAEAALQAVREAAGGYPVESLHREAEGVAAGILAAAEESGAEMIVMGRRGRRGLALGMVGHATAKVVGTAACPVLVVPKAARLWQRRVLLATDGSSFSEAAAVAAGRLASAFGLPATVVSVVLASHSEARRREAGEAVEREVARLRASGVEAAGRVMDGRADEAIVAAAEETGADLIVMGSHGRSGLKRILLGSVAERVIGQAECPVLVVRG